MNNAFKATVGDKTYDIRLGDPGAADINGDQISYDLSLVENETYSLVLNGKVYTIYMIDGSTLEAPDGTLDSRLTARGREVRLTICGHEYVVTVDDARSLLLRSYLSKGQTPSGTAIVRAPMPGLIVRVEVRQGEEIQPGQGLVVLEAMKMENEIRALTGGRVAAVHVTAGKPVEKGEPLVSVAKD